MNVPGSYISRKQRIQQANEAARSALSGSATVDADHIGDLVWWDPNPGWKMAVTDVEAAFVARGLDPAVCLPSPTSWPTAFSRAVQSVRGRIHPAGFTLLDAAVGPQGEHRVGILQVARNGRVTTDDVGTVACPKAGMPFVERDDPAGIARDIVRVTTEFYGQFTSDDIRTGATNTILRWAGMPCRQSPPHVVYWLPAAGSAAVRAFAEAVEAIGWGRVEMFAGYASDQRSARACVNAVNGGLEASLKAFADEAAAYASRDPAKTRVTTIEGKIEEAKRLRQQGALYREILGAAVVQVDARITTIESALKATLGLVEAAHA